MPNATPVINAVRSVKPRTFRSILASFTSGTAGPSSIRKRTPAKATSSPAAAPISARTTLSVSDCCSRRIGAAPSAKRSAVSFWRATPRARSRLATLLQAITRTKRIAPTSTWRTGRTAATVCAWRPATVAPRSRCGWIDLRNQLCQSFHLCQSVLHRSVRLEPTDDAIVMAAAGEVADQRNPYIRHPGPTLHVRRKVESLGHHSDDQMISTVNQDGHADDARVRIECALPQSIAQNGHVVTSVAGLFSAGRTDPPQDSRGARRTAPERPAARPTFLDTRRPSAESAHSETPPCLRIPCSRVSSPQNRDTKPSRPIDWLVGLFPTLVRADGHRDMGAAV